MQAEFTARELQIALEFLQGKSDGAGLNPRQLEVLTRART